jgi:hypothetical protein
MLAAARPADVGESHRLRQVSKEKPSKDGFFLFCGRAGEESAWAPCGWVQGHDSKAAACLRRRGLRDVGESHRLRQVSKKKTVARRLFCFPERYEQKKVGCGNLPPEHARVSVYCAARQPSSLRVLARATFITLGTGTSSCLAPRAIRASTRPVRGPGRPGRFTRKRAAGCHWSASGGTLRLTSTRLA